MRGQNSILKTDVVPVPPAKIAHRGSSSERLEAQICDSTFGAFPR